MKINSKKNTENIPLLENQFKRNLITNIFVFILSVATNIFLTPFYINNLGLDGFGLLRLALTIPMLTSMITIFISGSLSRYLIIAIQQGNHNEAIKVFNSGLFSLLALIFLSLPLFYFALSNLETFVELPERHAEDSFLLFIFIIGSAFFSIIGSIFLIPAQAWNRLDLVNYVNITSSLFKIFAIIFLLQTLQKIYTVGLAFFFSSILSIIISIFIWKKFASDYKINIFNVNYETLGKISSTGLWLLINHIGSVLFLYADLWIITTYFGNESAGEYSIVLQWSYLVRQVALVITSLFAPIIMIQYARKKFRMLKLSSITALKLVGIFLAIFISLIVGLSKPLLSIWLGLEYAYLEMLFWVLVLPLAVNLSVTPLFHINIAHNKTKIPALVTVATGITSVFFAIIVSKYSNLGILGVALVSTFMLSLKNIVFLPFYSAHIMEEHKTIFLKTISNTIFLVIIFSIVTHMLQSIFLLESWLNLFLFAGVLGILFMFLIWILVLSTREKKLLLKLIY